MKKILLVTLFGIMCLTGCNQKSSTQVENSQDEKINTTKTTPMSELTGNELKIVVNYTFKPEYKDELIKTFETMVDATRKEPGCIYYDLHQDINDSLKFVLLEYWKTKEDLDQHIASAHFKEYKDATEGKFESVSSCKIKQIY